MGVPGKPHLDEWALLIKLRFIDSAYVSDP